VKRADVDTKDAESQYAVGAMIFNRLYQKGGADKATYNPWPDPNADPKKAEVKIPPPFTMGDVMGAERVRLADIGVTYLNRAIALRPGYHEALAMLVLVYRQKAYAFLEKPADWQAAMDLSDEWKAKATQALSAAPGTPS
jgi:hypothetical protein